MNLDIVKSATKELEDARLVVEAAEAKLRAVVNDKGPVVTLTPKGAAAVSRVGKRKPAGPRGPKARKATPAETKRGPTLTPAAKKERKPSVHPETLALVESALVAATEPLSSEQIAAIAGIHAPAVRLAVRVLGAKVETLGKARATKYRWAGVSAGEEE